MKLSDIKWETHPLHGIDLYNGTYKQLGIAKFDNGFELRITTIDENSSYNITLFKNGHECNVTRNCVYYGRIEVFLEYIPQFTNNTRIPKDIMYMDGRGFKELLNETRRV